MMSQQRATSTKAVWAWGLDLAGVCAAATVLTVLAVPAYQRTRDGAEMMRRVGAASLAASAEAARAEGLALSGVPKTVSWRSVGGCGVGGGGGGGGTRWIGRRGGGGGLAEVEMLGSSSSGDDLTSTSVNVKVSAEAPGRLNVGLTLPFKNNVRSVPDHPEGESEVAASGPGDLNLSVSRKFGIEGGLNASLSIGIPTGEFKRYDGLTSLNQYYYPSDAQLGTGVMTASLQVETSIDKDWGPIILGGGYNANGGENEIGNMTADALSAYCYVGYRTMRAVHSVGVKLSQPLGKDKALGVETEESDGMLMTFQYGMEISSTQFPMFLAVSSTVNEEGEQDATTLSLGVMRAF